MYNYSCPPPHPSVPKPKPPPKPNPPPPKKPPKKFDFKKFKKDTCTSLNEVECFLCNFNSFCKYIKLYYLLKK